MFSRWSWSLNNWSYHIHIKCRLFSGSNGTRWSESFWRSNWLLFNNDNKNQWIHIDSNATIYPVLVFHITRKLETQIFDPPLYTIVRLKCEKCMLQKLPFTFILVTSLRSHRRLLTRMSVIIAALLHNSNRVYRQDDENFNAQFSAKLWSHW